jgi:hypothetical protein
LARFSHELRKTVDMTTLSDFQGASFEKKCDWVMGNSNYLVMRNLGEAKVYLYHAKDYFIEVYYSPVYKKILMINAFNSLAGLEPYTEGISLADLRL